MPRRMARREGRRNCRVTLALVIATVACLSRTSHGVKVVEIDRSLNATSYEPESAETNEVLQLEAPQRLNEDEKPRPVYRGEETVDPALEKEKDHPHSMLDKPTKFDLDVTGMIHTDRKNLHEAEAERLGNLSKTDESTLSTNRMDEPVQCAGGLSMACFEEGLGELLDDMAAVATINITESVQIVQTSNAIEAHRDAQSNSEKNDILDRVHRFAKNHVLRVTVPKELVTSRQSRAFFGTKFDGKNPFLTGFGLGFLAFGLKKLLLPLMIVAQLVKSMLFALFLPSIIGSIGKILEKGVSSFGQSSSQGATAQPEENFEFKDNSDLYGEDYMTRQPLGTLPASAMYDESMLAPTPKPEIASRYGFVDPRITNANSYSDRYYTRHVANNGGSKKQDFKIFHEIPTSSLLLTNYDPFYSPLLSRLDAVFSRLGHTTEGCREFAVCAMYRSPARYAPYSNLVSAQLSRELNELRRPSNDNPDVLRFFRYMKAAKDGQDGVRCEEAYAACDVARDDPSQRQNQAMLATYQDIDKLVQARKLTVQRVVGVSASLPALRYRNRDNVGKTKSWCLCATEPDVDET